jgi:hypothetical protein
MGSTYGTRYKKVLWLGALVSAIAITVACQLLGSRQSAQFYVLVVAAVTTTMLAGGIGVPPFMQAVNEQRSVSAFCWAFFGSLVLASIFTTGVVVGSKLIAN